MQIAPLEHGSLPDSEAQVIRALVDRIEALEQQVQNLQTAQSNQWGTTTVVVPSLVTVSSPDAQASPFHLNPQFSIPSRSETTMTIRPSCRIKD